MISLARLTFLRRGGKLVYNTTKLWAPIMDIPVAIVINNDEKLTEANTEIYKKYWAVMHNLYRHS